MQVAAIACEEADTARNMPFEVDPAMIANAIWGADAVGRNALECAKRC